MKFSYAPVFLFLAVILTAPLTVAAHQSGNENGHHRHPHATVTDNGNGVVYQQQKYGQGYRKGRSVNGPYGSIIIWSAKPNNQRGVTSGGGSKPNVHNMPSASTLNSNNSVQKSKVDEYGKNYKKDYGK